MLQAKIACLAAGGRVSHSLTVHAESAVCASICKLGRHKRSGRQTFLVAAELAAPDATNHAGSTEHLDAVQTAPDGLVEAARQAAQAGVASDKDSGEEEVEEAAASPNAHTVEPAPLSHDATQQHAAQGASGWMCAACKCLCCSHSAVVAHGKGRCMLCSTAKLHSGTYCNSRALPDRCCDESSHAYQHAL